jgi:aryl-alcohol dehydrogenase-like predicted oxidoreductase
LLAGSRGTTRAESDRLRSELRTADEDVVARVAEIARERGVSPAQIALAWLLHKPGVVAPIVGATRTGHIDDAAAATTLELDADELERLEACYLPRPPEPRA